MRNVAYDVLAHELRTPITVIGGMAATLERHHNDLPKEKVDEMLNTIAMRSQQLSEKIETVLSAIRTQP